MKNYSHEPRIRKVNTDKDYSICLLLGCIDLLARELALKENCDPELISTESLLKQSLKIQNQGTTRVYALLQNDYPWLTELLEAFN